MKNQYALLFILALTSLAMSDNYSIKCSLDYPAFFGNNYLTNYQGFVGLSINVKKQIIPFFGISGQLDYQLSRVNFLGTGTILNGFTPAVGVNVGNRTGLFVYELFTGLGVPIFNFINSTYQINEADFGISPIGSLSLGIALNDRLSIGLRSQYSFILLQKPNNSADVPYNRQINAWKNGIFLNVNI
jgi:hypothetical protein